MKGQTLVLLCALVLTKAGTVRRQTFTNNVVNSDPKQASIICAATGSDGLLVSHEHCNQYYQCWNGEPIVRSCSRDLYYNPITEVCDWPNDVECGDRVIPENSEGHDHDVIDEVATICSSEGSEDLLIAHKNCNKFYKCHEGKPVIYKCPGHLLYNSDAGYCDCDSNVICGDRIDSEEESEIIDENKENETDSENVDPNEAPSICATENSDGILIAHENCNKFYKCSNGEPVEFKCYGNLLFNPYEGHCDWPDNVECGERTISEESEENNEEGDCDDSGSTDNGDSDNNGSDNGGTGTCNCNPGEAENICSAYGSDGTLIAHENCDRYFQCVHGQPVVQKCPSGLLYNPYQEICDWPDNVECGERTISEDSEEINEEVDSEDNGNTDNGDSDNGGTGTCNCNPGEAENICSANGSDGTLIAHENCDRYFQCVHGQPIVQKCPSGLLYNPYQEICDWPDNVECGERTISEESEEINEEVDSEDNGNTDNGDSDNGGTGTCNCNPGEAENICSADGSDGTLIAHENCDRYFQCAHGQPIVQKCPSGLLYNPYQEICDWPDNVECGERTISEESEEINEEVDSEDNGNTDNGDSDNGGTGTCNCNPGEAENICSADGSDGTLIAHENCDRYFQCVHGQPIVQKCPSGLLYNPYQEICDWPDNVECGERTISEESEETNEEVDSIDNGNTDNGDSDNGGTGTCNCNPGEAENICSADGSDGTLIAHENCDRYFQCLHGQPIVQKCPSGLLYNPYQEICDWPDNFECGERTISEESEEINEEVDSEDNGNTDNGDSDNGGTGTCNCNPGEAENICSADGSDGTLIAHKNCDRYFQCVHGLPIVQKCPSGLLYNPYQEICDWPDNVECGERTISEDSEEINEEVDSEDNGNTDNGDSDNGGTGTCNCNPGEAENICSADGSDGTLIAHENCDRYFQCVHGQPIVQKCPSGLLYNPYQEICDWPDNVECGERTISEESEEISEEVDSEDNGNTDNGNSDNGGTGTCNCNPGEAENICSADGSDGTLIAHENCDRYFQCVHGQPIVQKCPSGLLYNPYQEICDWPDNVECGERTISEDSEEINEEVDSEDNGNTDNGDSDNGGTGTCNCNPGEAENICSADGSDGTLIAHENCDRYFQCVHGQPIVQKCPSGLLYNPYQEICDWPDNVECGERTISEESEETNEEVDSIDNGNTDNGGTGTCNCNPGEAENICSADGSDGTLIAHQNCDRYFQCVHGQPIVQKCPSGLLYNPYQEICDWPDNVECGERTISEDSEEINEEVDSEDNGNTDNGDSDNGGTGTCNCNPGEAENICSADGSDGTLIAHENCDRYFQCVHGQPIVQKCPSGLLYNPYQEICDWPDNVECGERTISEESEEINEEVDSEDNGNTDNGDSDNGGTGTCNCNPGEAKNICSADGSDGTLIAHENCDRYFQCVHGKPIVQKCPSGLLYNPYKEICDWSDNVECGERTISEESEETNEEVDSIDNGNTDNGGTGTCNCNPGEAENICSDDGSDGTLIAHENCDRYFQCVHGKPIIQKCPSGLLYNPYQEICDWSDNVECGERTISEDSEEINEEVDSEDNGNTDNGDSDNNGSDNGGTGTCNCNPGEAENICLADGSDGTLIAHENCDRYFQCVHGQPVVQKCPSGLLYNPYQEICDWSDNVECGNRLIPEDCEEDNGNGDSDNGDSENENTENGGAGTCNCNPGEATNICAVEGSDGVLIAHEDCDKYYQCVHGQPTVQQCPSSLLYNPYEERCDWSENVECGDRVKPEDCEENNGNGDSDNGDSENENNENEGTGTCNCNPSEAANICSAEGSDGALIAHEDCDKYYQCAHGQPTVQQCPSSLLYNPYEERCDWSDNVECGDRVKPEDCEENNSNGDSDNGDSENENNENEGAGTCNCNPSEAANICSAEGSDGALIAHENCDKYYQCVHGQPTVQQCPSSLLYNPYEERCDWSDNVECGDRVKPEDCEENNSNGDSDNGDSENENTENGGAGTCNCNPSEAANICSAESSNGVLIAHEDCDKYYQCAHGQPTVQQCPSSLLYNPYEERCDWSDNVECGNRVISEDDCHDNNTENDSNSDIDDSGEVDSDIDTEGECNNDPSQAQAICANENSGGVFVAHENCNQFYVCISGVPVTLNCSGHLLYNPVTEQCDWPETVVCGDRIVPGDDNNDCEDDDNSVSEDKNVDLEDENNIDESASSEEISSENSQNEGFSTDTEASIYCQNAGSDAIFLPHQNCNQFYVCVGNLPVVLECSGDLLFNENLRQCDLRENVDCKNRNSPQTDDSIDEDNTDMDNDNDSSEVPEDDSDNEVASNESDGIDSEVSAYCALTNSEEKVLPHENCNQYYICIGGEPVIRTCSGQFLFNSLTLQCDWPQNVNCDRATAGGASDKDENEEETNVDEEETNDISVTCSVSGTEGLVLPHENCNQYYVCIGGEPVIRTCSGQFLFNADLGQCDWPQNVNCNTATIRKISRINNNFDLNEEIPKNGASEFGHEVAEVKCALNESSGVIIPHEDCNKFYVCVQNHPVVFQCSSEYLYDVDRQQCFRRGTVTCGSRNANN